MTTTHRSNRTRPSLVVIAAVVATVMWLNGGSLTPPPGPIARTMKTLVHVEPRTAISAKTSISAPGSYSLIGGLDA